MIKFFLIFLLILSTIQCSFDNKSGIWTKNIKNKKENEFDKFKKLNTQNQLFDKTILPKKNLKITIDKIRKNYKWLDEFYQNSNNTANFSYKETNQLVFKSKKLINKRITKTFFDGKNFIMVNEKGLIVVYSISEKKIRLEFNFYKNKLKKINKNLNVLVDNEVIFISDNFGYLYALDYINNKLLWAKNYKIPFRSNIKKIENTIILSDINNSLYLIKSSSGEKLKIIPTEESPVKNEFINSIAVNENTIFYLNTYGSIYSINANGRINWFANINQFSDTDVKNLFNSKPIVLQKDRMVISTKKMTYVFDSTNGAQIFKIPITSLVKPLVTGNTIFLITETKLLVSLNLDTGAINYSIDINQNVADFLQTKKQQLSIMDLYLLNDNLYIFLNNSYYIKFNIKGAVSGITKLPSKISTKPKFINDSIIFLNNKNKLTVVD